MFKNFATASPDEFRTDLPNARIARTRNVTEVVAANVPGGVVKLRVIEDVEEFTSNLEVHCFIEWNHLRYAQIGVVDIPDRGRIAGSPSRKIRSQYLAKRPLMTDRRQLR